MDSIFQFLCCWFSEHFEWRVLLAGLNCDAVCSSVEFGLIVVFVVFINMPYFYYVCFFRWTCVCGLNFLVLRNVSLMWLIAGELW